MDVNTASFDIILMYLKTASQLCCPSHTRLNMQGVCEIQIIHV